MAEGGGLLNRCRTKSSTGGSNPPLSASTPKLFRMNTKPPCYTSCDTFCLTFLQRFLEKILRVIALLWVFT